MTDGVPGPGVGDGVGVTVLEPAGRVGELVGVTVVVVVAEVDGEAITGNVGVAEGDGRGVTEATVGIRKVVGLGDGFSPSPGEPSWGVGNPPSGKGVVSGEPSGFWVVLGSGVGWLLRKKSGMGFGCTI